MYRSVECHQNEMEDLLKQKEWDIKNIVLKHDTERKVHVHNTCVHVYIVYIHVYLQDTLFNNCQELKHLLI